MWVQPEPLSGLQPLDFYILQWRQEEEAQESQLLLGSWGNVSTWQFQQHRLLLDPDPVPWGSGLKALAPRSRAGGRLAAAGCPGNSGAFERQARTIGLNRPPLVASGKTERKGGQGWDLQPTDLHKRSSCPLLALTPQVFLPITPTGVEFQSLKKKPYKLNSSPRVCKGSSLTAPSLRLSCVIKGKHLSHRGSYLD